MLDKKEKLSFSDICRSLEIIVWLQRSVLMISGGDNDHGWTVILGLERNHIRFTGVENPGQVH